MSSNSSNSSKGGVIIKPPLDLNKKQISPSKKWCFTLNNYTSAELDMLSSIVPKLCRKAIIGKEVSESGTPHLQGYINLKVKARPKSIFNTDRIHWTKCLGTEDSNLTYCSKDGDVFLSVGFPPPLVLITNLYDYQKQAIELLSGEPDDRTILWFHGTKNIGKTQLLKLLCAKHKAHILPVSERHALSQVYKTKDESEIYCINLTADQSCYQKNELFTIIEAVKDGMFSASFGVECNGMCLFNSKHILVMANKPPDWSKTEIDRDRFKVYWIQEKEIEAKLQNNYPSEFIYSDE